MLTIDGEHAGVLTVNQASPGEAPACEISSPRNAVAEPGTYTELLG